VTVRLPSPEQKLWLELLVSQSQRDLAADIAAQTYLKERGFTEAIATQWRLGLVTSPPVGAENQRGRLCIPYITPSGVVNARFRCLRDHKCSEAVLFTDQKGKPVYCQKYKGLEGWETSLFNVLDLAKPGDAICVTEGELDAVTLSMCGIAAVAVPGATNWKKHMSRCLDDFGKVFTLGDGDDAGRGLNKRLIDDVRAVPVRMPKGHDVNSLYLEGGRDALRKLISG
jgi:DNA primase